MHALTNLPTQLAVRKCQVAEMFSKQVVKQISLITLSQVSRGGRGAEGRGWGGEGWGAEGRGGEGKGGEGREGRGGGGGEGKGGEGRGADGRVKYN